MVVPAPIKRRPLAAITVVILATVVAWLAWQGFDPSMPTGTSDRIAVLPFENLGEPDDAYFAEGMTEEVASRLAQAGMSVIARESAMQYAGTQKPLRQIGRELDVGYVLEGKVQWAHDEEGAGRIRVTPRLVRVEDETNVWASTYDRSFADVFEVQTDVARQILEKVGGFLEGGQTEVGETPPTQNLEAYQSYLRGVATWNYRNETEERRVAIRLFERAVELDSSFALAYAELAKVVTRSYRFGAKDADLHLPYAKRAAERALELAPSSAESHHALALYYYWGQRDYDQALVSINAAIELNPASWGLYETRGAILRRMGQWRTAQVDYQRGVRFNPRSASTFSLLGQTHQYLRQYDDAIGVYNKAIMLEPDGRVHYMRLAEVFLYGTAQIDSARQTFERMPLDMLEISAVVLDMFDKKFESALELATRSTLRDKEYWRALCLSRLGRTEEAARVFEAELNRLNLRLTDQPDNWFALYRRGAVLANLGRKEEAIRDGRRALELLPPSKDTFATDMMHTLVGIYAYVGEIDAAMDQIEFILSNPSKYSMSHFRICLLSEWLPTDHPRFQELEKRFAF